MGQIYEGDAFQVVPVPFELKRVQDELKKEIQSPKNRKLVLEIFSVEELVAEIDSREEKHKLGDYDPSVLKKKSTKELVDELKVREGVETHMVNPDGWYEIFIDVICDEIQSQGPAIILVVTD